ncbi:hypothetical protein E1B28_006231 [Marasmius oreades]|uniref:Uncharacterized protein n=1 Tax=Marasmius oreades TaxID=181124 RepID=A0A9P7UV26_9AGAR|nr:uncharacterized protein E1B28_006231 [Marasmius oreades]KAG7095492.1 hypothetical protein E1B28_006231 [Marasmius oreades]
MDGESCKADIVIVGGGPVGSLLAYQLARFGCKPFIIEQEDKTRSARYGRATTFWPRTIELLDQLDLADRLLQTGVVSRSGLHFHEGRRVKGGIMYGSRMDRLGDTFFKFALHLRQRLTEEQFSSALEEYGFQHHNRHVIESYSIHDGIADDHPVTVRARDLSSDCIVQIKTKYLVGADGGKSTVRKLADIPFDGENTKHRWIRMDARVRTNMPNSRCLNSVDSATHGQIVWCPIDNGLTRIGYVLSSALLERYGGVEAITQDIAVEEAKKALHPFELEFVSVEWFTVYGIGQRIAKTFYVENRVFLAGDACHTHSSGSAQGLNTGVHDAVNLAWKLALCIHGLARPSILDSYNDERRPIVQQVIDNDKVISMLISGQYPPRFQGRRESTREILTEWFDDMSMQAFTLGLGISYPVNTVNREFPGPSRSTVNPGDRGPDVYLTELGTGDMVRLHTILKNDGKFSLVVFAGIPTQTMSSFSQFREAVFGPFTKAFPARAFKWFTIPSVHGNGGQEIFVNPPMGKVYLDESVKAHDIYGVDIRIGAVIVFRPDGWVGTVVEMSEYGVVDLTAYFEHFLNRRDAIECNGVVAHL